MRADLDDDVGVGDVERDIADAANLSVPRVSIIAKRAGAPQRITSRPDLTPEVVAAAYAVHGTLRATASHLHTTTETVQARLKAAGLTLRRGSRRRDTL